MTQSAPRGILLFAPLVDVATLLRADPLLPPQIALRCPLRRCSLLTPALLGRIEQADAGSGGGHEGTHGRYIIHLRVLEDAPWPGMLARHLRLPEAPTTQHQPT
jgi:hypothetical protein